jgi:two-component system KDP operon response regulator KdpE
MDEKKKILAVDDEPQILRVLRHILGAHGYVVRTAEDGISALEVFHEWPPDLVLTDLQMPDMDGLQLCKEIRSISQVPIVILSVRDEEETIVETLDAGADDYVTKPFGTSELLARLRSAFRRAPAKESDLIEAGQFQVDVPAHVVKLDGKLLRLTPKEFDLIVCFLRNQDRCSHALVPASKSVGKLLRRANRRAFGPGRLAQKKDRGRPSNRSTFKPNHGSAIDSLRHRALTISSSVLNTNTYVTVAHSERELFTVVPCEPDHSSTRRE